MICENCGKTHDGTYASGRFCSKGCSKSFSTKAKRKEINEKVSKTVKSTINKRLNNGENFGYIKPKVKYYCGNCSKELFRKTKSGLCRKCLISTGMLSKFMKGKCGGVRQGSVRNYKYGNYKGYYYDSSWELAWIIYNLDNGIKFERNINGFPYMYKGKSYNFHPDFILGDGTYVEIKGYDKKVKAKLESFKEKLILIGKEEIKFYIEYVRGKYGKNYL